MFGVAETLAALADRSLCLEMAEASLKVDRLASPTPTIGKPYALVPKLEKLTL